MDCLICVLKRANLLAFASMSLWSSSCWCCGDGRGGASAGDLDLLGFDLSASLS